MRKLPRREFLKTGLAASIIGPSALAASKQIPLSDAIPAAPFGGTGHRLPVLSCGGSAMVEKWKSAYGPMPAFEQRVKMIRSAYEAGIRYFDTSRNYGESESIMGEGLDGVREDVFLASKVGVSGDDTGLLERGQVRASVEESLKLLRTDYLDCIQIHGPVFEYLGYDRAMELYEEVNRLRDEKVTRFIGLTGHNAFQTMHRLIDTGLFDQLLIAYGYFPKGMDTILSKTSLEWREKCLNRASELGMAVLAMKVMGSYVFGYHAGSLVPSFGEAKLAKLRQAALRWALHDKRITTLLVGVTRPSDTEQNAETLRASHALTTEDRKLLAEFTAEALETGSIKKLKVT
ncbi:MAG: aldo/keto reductase [bacterium]|nr:aldo/keto reductase [bacterium]